MTYYYFFLVFNAAVFSTLPIMLLKEYIKNKKITYILLIIISYIILTYLYYMLFSDKDIALSKIYIFVKILSILIISVYGFFYLKDKITTANIFGTILGLGAIVLLS